MSIKFLEAVPLAPYTYLKVGGPAQYLFIASSVKDLKEAIILAQKKHLPLTILGSASNVCISDTGLDGLVIINRFQQITQSYADLAVSSGTLMSQLVNFALKHSLGGLEEFLGIPGTVGGAIVNNSHYLNHLIGDFVKSVTALDSRGQEKIYTQKNCDFGYDRSIFQKNKEIILAVTFSLTKALDSELLKKNAMAALKRRQSTQPLDLPSSGCMFKNPQAPHPAAGYLIDQAGLKGTQIGGVIVSEKHANFMVNTGQAKAQDLVQLSNFVCQKVFDKYGIWLEREIFFLGNHPDLKKPKFM